MNKSRVEAFSDGVLAIVITIMVLELKVPTSDGLDVLAQRWPIFLGYILSFIYVGIYWTNHHHLFQAVKIINGKILWANLHLLFWLSLFPFVSAWAGESHFSSVPVAAYGFVLLMAAFAYRILVIALTAHPEQSSLLQQALGTDFKGKISIVLYALSLPFAFYHPGISLGLFTLVAAIWLIPDMRIEKVL